MNQYQTIPDDILDKIIIDVPDIIHHVNSLRDARSNLVAELFERDIAALYLTSDMSNKDTRSLSNSDIINLVLTRKRLGWDLLRAERALDDKPSKTIPDRMLALINVDYPTLNGVISELRASKNAADINRYEKIIATSYLHGSTFSLTDDERNMLLMLKNK